MTIALSLLIAFMLSCFGSMFRPHSDSEHLPHWYTFTNILNCFGSQGSPTAPKPPNCKQLPPDPWRFQAPSPRPREKAPFVWPANMDLHLFVVMTVAIHMWFYALHLRAFGFSLQQWTLATFKLLCPQQVLRSLRAPFLYMKATRWRDSLKNFMLLAPGLPALYWHVFFRDTYYRPEAPPPPKPKLQGSKSKTKKIILASLAALSTLSSAGGIQLRLEQDLRNNLQRYKNSAGRLNTAKLGASKSPHAFATRRALISQLRSEVQSLEDVLDPALQICTAVIDSGATFTTLNSTTLIVPGSLVKLDVPIELDGIAGGYMVEYKCLIKFECVKRNGDPYVRETEAFYHPDLPCMLLSPQAFLQDQYLRELRSAETLSHVKSTSLYTETALNGMLKMRYNYRLNMILHFFLVFSSSRLDNPSPHSRLSMHPWWAHPIKIYLR